MERADYHLHSQFSPDGRQTMEEACTKAIELGYSELCFTDHLEAAENTWIDYEAYRRGLEAAREKFGSKLSLKLGLEVGFDSQHQKAIENYLRNKEFDFLIGSLHFINGIDLFKGSFFEDKTVQEAIREYFQVLYELSPRFDFSVLGHITLFKRFFDRLKVSSADFTWEYYDDLIRAILENLIAQGKGIELNMRVPLIDLDWRVLRLYKDCGGEIVTLGTDAHYIRSMQTMKDGFEALRNVGFRYYCRFANRKPIFMPL